MTHTQAADTVPLMRLADQNVFGLEIPWLPAIHGHDKDAMVAMREAFGRQIAMLRALAESGQQGHGVLQLRIVVAEQIHSGRSSPILRIVLLGAARKAEDALNLRERVLATLPPEFVYEHLAVEVQQSLVDSRDLINWTQASIVEIRRAIESSDPEGDAGQALPTSPVLLRWTWTSVNLVASLGALHKLPVGAQLIVHLEPRAASADALGFLREEIANLRDTYQDQMGENPLVAAVYEGYRQWLRDLPRASVHLRVLLACPGFDVPAGVAEIVGADLTRSWDTGPAAPVGTFDVVQPSTYGELDNALALVQLLRSQPIRPPDIPELAELLHLFDPHEASAAFRIPLPGADGLPGLRTEPASDLPRGLASAVSGGHASIVLGTGPSGDTVTLSHSEINRHLLVAGLPGYGKTTTVQTILRQLWTAPEQERVPFLVLDPAKTDYRTLAKQLGDDCDLIELRSDRVAFNPLQCPDGVPPAVFATRIAAAFDATYDLSTNYPAAATLLTRAVYRTISDPVPTLTRLYATVRELIVSSEYSERVKGDLEAALTNRLEFLTDGSLGTALMGQVDAGVDWAKLLSRPTVILTRQFAGPRERALLMSFLLAGLVSYREYHPVRDQPDRQKERELGHVTVVEEAHRILAAGKNSGFVNDGAQVFVDAMAELRGAGEGFVVVEQAPSRLVPEVRKLVGTVIAHRTVDAEERAVLASSLTLPGNEHALARLAPGKAIVLAADMMGPAVVDVDRGDTTASTTEHVTRYTLTGEGTPIRLWCQQCPVVCTGYDGALAIQIAMREQETPDLEKTVPLLRTMGFREDETYCALAFIRAQQSPTSRDWDARRQELLADYAKATKTKGRAS